MKQAILAAMVAALGSSGVAFAQMGSHGPEFEGMDHGHIAMLMKAAKLTDDQKAQVHQIMRETHEQSRPLVKQVRALREQLSEKIIAPGPLQLSDLLPLRQQIRDLTIQIDDKALGAVIKIHSLLKPEQAQRIADVHAKFKSLHSQMDELVGPPDDMEMEHEHD